MTGGHLGRILLGLGMATLCGCSTLGTDFEESHALKIRKGMTREEVIATMGSPPSEVEGTNDWRLTWIYTVSDPISFGSRSKRVTVTFDDRGHAEGVPPGGIVPDIYQ
ncbi:MAG: SmpA / OmlA family [Pseudomonadota bacterium]|jgi:outer membrane protein assembly factor BamE (lipoprotein component of BamABCDE complex)